MFLAIDVGGTKTLVASFTNDGKLSRSIKFKTPLEYNKFIGVLKATLARYDNTKFKYACVALPGKINRKKGIGIAFGNLAWKEIPIKKDLKKFIKCPIVIENDANLAARSEALNVINDFHKVLYLTVSTGIGSGIITNGVIDPDFADSEAGQMKVQFNGKMQYWEDIAAGSAILKHYGKIAADINDKKTWQEICYKLGLGINTLIATLQPEVIIIGGGVGTHFKKYGKLLKAELKKYSTPLTPVPPIIQAKNSEQAVIFGCYILAIKSYEQSSK